MISKETIKIAIAKNDSFIQAIETGNLEESSYINGIWISCKIKNVFYVPSLRKNFLSVKGLEMSNINVMCVRKAKYDCSMAMT